MQRFNNQIKPFRTEPEKVIVWICQSLCPDFQKGVWKACTPCPTGRLRERTDPQIGKGWSVILPNATLEIFPTQGIISVIKERGKIKNINSISAFASFNHSGTCEVNFYNPKGRLILAINEFGTMR